MKTMNLCKKLMGITVVVILVMATMTTTFADTAKPAVNFTDSGVIYNKDIKLLRFNLKWTNANNEAIDVMYSFGDGKAKKLGSYENQQDQIIAHVYLDDDELNESVLNVYAVDENGNKSEVISSSFQGQGADSSGVTISDGPVPMAAPDGTWSLVNLFLSALSLAMVAVSSMLFFENRKLDEFRTAGKINSTWIYLLTVGFATINIVLFVGTQSLKHQMVMIDNMTLSILIVAVLGIITTMVLAVRAFSAQSQRDIQIENI